MTVPSSSEDSLLVEVQNYNLAQQSRRNVRQQNSVKSFEELYHEATPLFLNLSYQPNVDAPLAQQQQERDQHFSGVVQQWDEWCHNVSLNKEKKSGDQAFQLEGMRYSVYFIRALWEWSQTRLSEEEADQRRNERESRSNDISTAPSALFFTTDSAAQQQSLTSSNKEEQLVQKMIASLELIYCSMISLGYFDSRSSSQKGGETVNGSESSIKIRPAFSWLTEPLRDKTQNASTQKTVPSSLDIRSIIQTWEKEQAADEPALRHFAKRSRTRYTSRAKLANESVSDGKATIYKKAILSLPWILMHRVSDASIQSKAPPTDAPSASAVATSSNDTGGLFGTFHSSQNNKKRFADPPYESQTGKPTIPERKKLSNQLNRKWKTELFYIFSNADLAQYSDASRPSSDVAGATISWAQLEERATQIREWCHPLLPAAQSPPAMHSLLVCLGLDLLAMRTPRAMLLAPAMADGGIEWDESAAAEDMMCYVDMGFASKLASLRGALPWKVASMEGFSAGTPQYLAVEGLDHMSVTRQLQKPGVLRAMQGLCYPEEFPFSSPKASSSTSTARTIFSYYETMTMLDILDCFLAAPRTTLSATSALELLANNHRLNNTKHFLKLFNEENIIPGSSAGTPAQGSKQSTSSSTAIKTFGQRIKSSLWSFGMSALGASSTERKSLHNPWLEMDLMLLHRLLHTKLTLVLQAQKYSEACALCNQVEESMASTSPVCTKSWELFVHEIVRQHNGDQMSSSNSSHVDPPILSDGACYRLSEILNRMDVKASGIKTVEGYLSQQISTADDPNTASAFQKVMYDFIKPRKGKAEAYAAVQGENSWIVKLASVTERRAPGMGILAEGDRFFAEDEADEFEEEDLELTNADEALPQELVSVTQTEEVLEEEMVAELSPPIAPFVDGTEAQLSIPNRGTSKRGRSPSASPPQTKKSRTNQVDVVDVLQAPIVPEDRAVARVRPSRFEQDGVEDDSAPVGKERKNDFDNGSQGEGEGKADGALDSSDDEGPGDEDRGGGGALVAATTSSMKAHRSVPLPPPQRPPQQEQDDVEEDEIEIIDSSDDEADLARHHQEYGKGGEEEDEIEIVGEESEEDQHSEGDYDEYDSDAGMRMQASVSSSDAHDADQSSEGGTQASSDSESEIDNEVGAGAGQLQDHDDDDDDVIELDSDGDEVQIEQGSDLYGAPPSEQSHGYTSVGHRGAGVHESSEEPSTPIASQNREAAMAWRSGSRSAARGLDHSRSSAAGRQSMASAVASHEQIPFGDEADFTDRATADHVSSEEDEAPMEVKIDGPSSDGTSVGGSDTNKGTMGSEGEDDDATARFKTEARSADGIPPAIAPPEEQMPRRAASVAASDRATADHVSSDSDDAAPLEVRINATVGSKDLKAKEEHDHMGGVNEDRKMPHGAADRARIGDLASASPHQQSSPRGGAMGRKATSDMSGRSSILRSVFKSDMNASRQKDHHVHMDYDTHRPQPDSSNREQQEERPQQLGDHSERPPGGWASTVASDRATADHVSSDEDEAPLEISAPPVVKQPSAAAGGLGAASGPGDISAQLHQAQPTSMVEDANPQDEADHAGPVVQAASTVASDRATADHVSSDSEDEAPIVVHIDPSGNAGVSARDGTVSNANQLPAPLPHRAEGSPRDQRGVVMPPEVHDAPAVGHAGSTVGSDRATADHASESEDDAPLEVHIGASPDDRVKPAERRASPAMDVDGPNEGKISGADVADRGPVVGTGPSSASMDIGDSPAAGAGLGAWTVASDRATADTDVSSDYDDAPIEVHIAPAPVDVASRKPSTSPPHASARENATGSDGGQNERHELQVARQNVHAQVCEDNQLPPGPLGITGAASTTLSDRATADASSSEDEAPLVVHIGAPAPGQGSNSQQASRRSDRESPADQALAAGNIGVLSSNENDVTIPVPPPPVGLGASTVASDRATADHVSSDEDEAPIEVHIGNASDGENPSQAQTTTATSPPDEHTTQAESPTDFDRKRDEEGNEDHDQLNRRRTGAEEKGDQEQPHMMGGGDTVATDSAMADHVSSDEDEAPIEVRIGPNTPRSKSPTENASASRDNVVLPTKEVADLLAAGTASEPEETPGANASANDMKVEHVDEVHYPEKGDLPKGTDTVATDGAIADQMTSDEEDAPIEIRVAAEDGDADEKNGGDADASSPDNADMPPPDSVLQQGLEQTEKEAGGKNDVTAGNRELDKPRHAMRAHDKDSQIDADEEDNDVMMDIDEEAEETDLAVADDDSISSSEDDAGMPALRQLIKPPARAQSDDLEDAETMTISNLTDVAVAGRFVRETEAEAHAVTQGEIKEKDEGAMDVEESPDQEAMAEDSKINAMAEDGVVENDAHNNINEMGDGEANPAILADADLIEMRMERGSFVSDRAIADNKSDFTDDEAPVEVHIRPQEADKNLVAGDLSSDNDDKMLSDDGDQHNDLAEREGTKSAEAPLEADQPTSQDIDDQGAAEKATDEIDNGDIATSPAQEIGSTTTPLATVNETEKDTAVDSKLESTPAPLDEVSANENSAKEEEETAESPVKKEADPSSIKLESDSDSKDVKSKKEVTPKKELKSKEVTPKKEVKPTKEALLKEEVETPKAAPSANKVTEEVEDDNASVVSGRSTRSNRSTRSSSRLRPSVVGALPTAEEDGSPPSGRGGRPMRQTRAKKSAVENVVNAPSHRPPKPPKKPTAVTVSSGQLPPRPKRTLAVAVEAAAETSHTPSPPAAHRRMRSNSDMSDVSEVSALSPKNKKIATRAKKKPAESPRVSNVPPPELALPLSRRLRGGSVTSDHTGKSRGSKMGCACRTGCKNMRCSCKKTGHVCTEDCGCKGMCEGNANPDIIKSNAKG